VGANDFRISDMGPNGDTKFAALYPAVAYNGVNNEYLVAWTGDDTTDDEYEIYGQRLAAATGAEVGANDFRISDMGPEGNPGFSGYDPEVAYNGANNEYLVAWWGDDDTAPLVKNEFEIFGQRLAATGAEVGVNDFRISHMGPDGNTNYGASSAAVAYSGASNEYLAVWAGVDDFAGLVAGESVIFGQRIAAPPPPIGSQFPPPGNEVETFGQSLAQPDPPPPPPPPPPIMAAASRAKGVAQVRVTDAATGELRAVLTPFKGFRGRLRCRLEDVNGDGALELVVRALVKGRRKQKVFDAATLAPLPPGLT
jgi:hypothetical protein